MVGRWTAGIVPLLAVAVVVGSCNDSGTTSRPPTLTATVSASPVSGFAPLTATVTVSPGGTAQGIIRYHVEFGDGISDTISSQGSYTVNHEYQSGTYTVSARIERAGLTA